MNRGKFLKPDGYTATRNFVVDLDGTLLLTDLLVESTIQFAINETRSFMTSLPLLTGDIAEFKKRAAKSFVFEPEDLPYNAEVLELVRQKRIEGYRIILASGSDHSLVDKIAAHFELFELSFGSVPGENLIGSSKADRLDSVLGTGNYEYVGDSKKDYNVWVRSQKGYLVASGRRTNRKLDELVEKGKLLHISPKTKSRLEALKVWAKALRMHQWSKNLLLLIPAIATFDLFTKGKFVDLVLGFISFSLVSSSVYLLNDIADLQNDRSHPTKRHRPFASGLINPLIGAFVALVLLISGLAMAVYQQSLFLPILVGYYVLTLFYSLKIKKLILFDILTLAFLYTLRIFAGGALSELQVSFWLACLSMFFFTSLALAKRLAELKTSENLGRDLVRGRGYGSVDIPVIVALGAATALTSVLVLALYLDSSVVYSTYASPQLAWLAVPVMFFFIVDIWFVANRGQMHEDPVFYVLKNRKPVVTLIALLIILFVSYKGLLSLW